MADDLVVDLVAEPSPDERWEQQIDPGEALSGLASVVIGKRTRAIAARNFIERRWVEDLRAYGRERDSIEGRVTVMDAATGVQPVKGNELEAQHRSTLYIHLLRARANAAEARIADLLFPSDDRNWGIKPTPEPKLSEESVNGTDQIVHNGQPIMVADPDAEGGMRPMTGADLAQGELQKAERRAKRMQERIDDQLNKCSYNGEARKAIHDASVIGVGILKGPIVVGETKKAWLPPQVPGQPWRLKIVEETRPSSERVDPWNFFPAEDCGEDPHDGSHLFERKYLSPRRARDLAKLEGVNLTQLRAALKQGPKRVTVNEGEYQDVRRETGYTLAESDHYELWIYTGDVTRHELELCGCDPNTVGAQPLAPYGAPARDSGGASQQGTATDGVTQAGVDQTNQTGEQFATAGMSAASWPMQSPNDGDPLDVYSGHIWMLNDRIIKAAVNMLDTGEFPYDIFTWERIEGSWCGQGIPRLARSSNKMFTAAIRALMENAGQTVGPQIVIDKKCIVAQDGRNVITGRKLWLKTDSSVSVNDAFGLFDIPNHQQEFIAIAELGMKFIDDETNFPLIAQGEKGTAPDQVGSMQLLMNSANVVLRRLVKRWDDQITRRHIARYYDWNMQYSDDPDIKGDMYTDARGSGALLERDLQNQHVMQALGLVTHPVFGPMLKPLELLKLAFQSLKLPADDIVRSNQEIERIQKAAAEKGQQLPPEIEAKLKIAAAQEQTKMQQDATTRIDIATRFRESIMKIMAGDQKTTNEMRKDLAALALTLNQERALFYEDIAVKHEMGSGIIPPRAP